MSNIVGGPVQCETFELADAFSAERYLHTLEPSNGEVSTDNETDCNFWSLPPDVAKYRTATHRTDPLDDAELERLGGNKCDSGCSQSDAQFGHLGERLLKAGRGSLTDLELLLLVLGQAGLRGVSNIFLEELLTRFRGFGGVIGAPAGALACIDGLGQSGAVALKLVHAGVARLLEIEVPRGPLILCWDHLMAYLRVEMVFSDVEEVRIVYLDARNRVIVTESQGRGTVNHCPLYPRDVVCRALQLNASALVVARNHPSGDPTPSRLEVLMATDLVEVASRVGIAVHDHIVLGRYGCFSFRGNKVL